ncbi:hypothetical protein [Nocardia sp. NRRL S-836]|uniref:hypothetical protein n=1 Tax=Nocardia sp. NRRL S-836 TaxID=1519492 RepID=UPI0006AEA164|nr:hypothetical protein [Nocardia sp. NRRL S-836]KOV87577.1 hypothetical protein ADL03_06685 [Nocardia sp. NRRL S-836]
MWAWLIGGYAVVLALLIGFAGFVASWVDDEKKRADAFKVVKLLVVAVTGSGGLFAAAMALHQAGLL